ncbi:MAG: hypothetical protein HYZ69_00100 [Candidatus Colwellbacteria bacterium]|nr:hypothetical protein [Candidatus Colwellbacteria bacterium]
MKLSYPNIKREKWEQMLRKDQMQAVAAELLRISSGILRYGNNDKTVKAAYERLFDLIDMIIQDPKWRENLHPIFVLRDAAAELYVGKKNPAAVANALHILLMER